MIGEQYRIHEADIIQAIAGSRQLIPFFFDHVPAGFTSPAENFIERVCDLNDLCIRDPECTYFAKCAGDSMIDDGLWHGDIMIVDRSQEHYEGRLLVVWLNDGFTVKRYHESDGVRVLMPANPLYAPIYVQESDDSRVFGEVTFWLKKAQIKKVFQP